MTPPLAWAEELLTQGHPLPHPSFSTHCPLEGPERKSGSRSRKEEEREVGRKRRKGGRKRKEETGWTGGVLEEGGDGMGEELYTSKLNL